MKHNTISVFEYDKLRVGEHALFTEPIHKALECFYHNNGQKYFSLIPRGVRFCEFVGVIQVNGIQIEILPKLDRNDTDVNAWRNVLIDMLREVGMFRVSAPSSGMLSLKSNSILELYFELFISEVDYLVRTGLIKQYRRQSGNHSSLKGSLDFPRHLAKNLVHQERFFTRSSIYDPDHLWHQILSQTIDLIRRISQNSDIHNRISSLKLNFPEVSPRLVTVRSFETLNYSRKTEGYRKAMEIARLLLCNYHPDLKTGRNNVLALMFDMNSLWESFVFHSLRKQFVKHSAPYSIKAQLRRSFWSTGNHHSLLKPDIYIRNTVNNQEFILDTKWKIPTDNKPSSSDLQQLFAYSHYFCSAKNALLYPGQKDNITLGYYQRLPNMNEQIQCSVILLGLKGKVSAWQESIYSVINGWLA